MRVCWFSGSRRATLTVDRNLHNSSFSIPLQVHIQGGQCGNQIGAKFWEVISDGKFCCKEACVSRCSPSAVCAILVADSNTPFFFLQSTAWTPPVPTMVTLTCSWSASTCTTTRQLVRPVVCCVVLSCVGLANKRHTDIPFCRRTLCAPCRPDGLGARNHGLCPCWTFRTALPPRQLRVWPDWCR